MIQQARIALMFLLYLFSGATSYGQMVGIPFVDSYSKSQYGYGTQNWDIEQAKNGVLYFANNEGLLEFDGARWRLFPLPNKTILRSLVIKENGIYVGGQNEFGWFKFHPHFKWRFHSLKSLIPEAHQGFEDVWDMQQSGDDLLFRASEKIFILRDTQVRVITEIPVRFLGKAGQHIFAQHKKGPLYILHHDSLSLVPGSEEMNGTEITKIITCGNDFLIATRKKGIFHYNGILTTRWKTKGENTYEDHFINSIDVLKNGDIVIGTSFKGVIIIDSLGQYRYRISTEDGLANNRVICTFVDRHKNLWVGLDNGISMVRTNSPFSRIYPDGELEGAGYDVSIFGDKIYFGSSSGLFYSDWGEQTLSNGFQLIKNTSGQVWGIDLIDKQLILSHNDGAFLIDDQKAFRFFDETGAWLFKKDETNDQVIFSGSYKGINIFEKGSLRKRYEIPGLSESSRFIVQDKSGNYWMAHPYRGVYLIESPQDPKKTQVKLLGPEQGLPSYLHNHVFKINEQILVCGERGIFVFNSPQNTFEHYQPMEQFLGAEVKVRRLVEGTEGDIWFITDQEIGVLEIEEQGLEKQINKRVFLELKNLMNGGWEKIYPYDHRRVFITTINGFLHYDGRDSNENDKGFDIILDEIVINKDSILYLSEDSPTLELSYNHNALLFKMAATEYVNNKALMFQFFLEGFDEAWTPLNKLRSKEYTNLSPGAYRLQVKALNQNGKLSSVFSIPFEILKPWYLSLSAKGFYLLAFLSIGYLLYKRSRKKFTALEQKVDSTVKKSKAEIQRLETEKIQAELEHKKRELVSATLHLVKKNETMSNLAEQLMEIKKKSEDSLVSRQLEQLVNFLKKDEVMDEGWEQVMYHFNELNKGFFDRLKKAYPSLTPKDLKLCAYLKMNLTTKEMATLMNVSLRGIEASRYRLRKKMQLSSEDNLTAFLMEF